MHATAHEVDIRPSCMQMLKDIGHPFADGKPVYDVTFENVQAGERTSHLFRLANVHNAPVVGTSDLSELGAGVVYLRRRRSHGALPRECQRAEDADPVSDPLCMRAPANSVPEVSAVLEDVLDTPISPELVPGKSEREPGQSTEAVVGPYELQDFHLYYILRFGYLPTKVAFMAWCTWRDRSTGNWPEIPAGSAQPIRYRRHQEMAARVRAAFLPVRTVQAQRHPERTEGGLGRLTFPAQRLPRAQRQRSGGLAGRRRADSGQESLTRKVCGTPFRFPNL